MQDLWYIGKAIGLPDFDDVMDSQLDEMNAALRRAKRDDSKSLRGTEESELQSQAREYLGGRDESQQTDARQQFVAATWIKKIREKYRGSVIRRTVNSLDHDGIPISELEPYEQHRCVIELFKHEYAELDLLAERATDGETFAKRFSSEVRPNTCEIDA